MTLSLLASTEIILKDEFNRIRYKVLLDKKSDALNYVYHRETLQPNADSMYLCVPEVTSKSPFFVYKARHANEETKFDFLVKIVPSSMSKFFLLYFKYSVETIIGSYSFEGCPVSKIKNKEANDFLRSVYCLPVRPNLLLSDIYDAYFCNLLNYLKKIENDETKSYESEYKKFLFGFFIAYGFTFCRYCELRTEYKLTIDFHRHYDFDSLNMYLDFIVLEKKYLEENFENFDRSKCYNICIFEVGDGIYTPSNLEIKVQQVLIYILSFYLQFKLLPGNAMIIVIYRDFWSFFILKIEKEWVNDFYLLKKSGKNDFPKKIEGKSFIFEFYKQTSKHVFLNYLMFFKTECEKFVAENLDLKIEELTSIEYRGN